MRLWCERMGTVSTSCPRLLVDAVAETRALTPAKTYRRYDDKQAVSTATTVAATRRVDHHPNSGSYDLGTRVTSNSWRTRRFRCRSRAAAIPFTRGVTLPVDF